MSPMLPSTGQTLHCVCRRQPNKCTECNEYNVFSKATYGTQQVVYLLI